MRLKAQLAVLFTLALVATASAQDNLPFYEELARKDAHREQSSIFSNLEDEKDFWYDQVRYEKELKKQQSTAYKVYMEAKRVAYSKHAEECNNSCTHSDYYYQQASFYFTYKNTEIFAQEATDGIVQVASPRIF
ncbi:hypothetical protein PY092_15920 [Muricauda sp. 334s03]|uniref:Uncharacterized protein n=1 Tax=Flagellimonas yonaguniensis TaxID=3031325 RepID=A0ABT5Y2W8_9FLAO|nr:hypothetical protein [[Muricauda] yonaguniensis]MDF0717651.1 hypothetical protein [[Muricauda] yonaguniensis]